MDIKADKVRENYCRRWSKRLGLFLKKSRAKRFSIDNQGGYTLITFDNIDFAGPRFDLTLDQVEELLDERDKVLRTESSGWMTFQKYQRK